MSETLEVDLRVATAREFVAQVLNGHDPERARDFFTADVVWHGGALGTVNGVDTVVPLLGGFISALTDIDAAEEDVIASGDLVALRLVVSATHTGNLLGVPATDRPHPMGRRRHLSGHGRPTDQRAVGLRGSGGDPQPGGRDLAPVGELTSQRLSIRKGARG